MSKVVVAKKLKILCLHGYFQTAAIMKDRTPALYRKLKSIAEFHGPITVNCMEGFKEELGTEKVGKGWWIIESDGKYTGVDKTVDYVLDYYKKEGPFDGILGFSQGAGLALYLAALQEKGDIATDFKFIVSYSGFYPSDENLQKTMDDRKISIPSMHLIGKEDNQVDPKSSERVTECFIDPVIKYHAGGHFIPQNGEIKEAIHQFVLPFVTI